jgi:hypothetical protein
MSDEERKAAAKAKELKKPHATYSTLPLPLYTAREYVST